MATSPIGRTGILVLAALMASSWVALAADSSPKPVEGGTAVLLGGGEIQTLNPMTNNGPGEVMAGCMVHEGLIEMKEDGTPQPNLAKSWTVSEDRRTYTFDLVDANWHDGKPFTSADVAYFMTDVTKVGPTTAATIGTKIQKVETQGDHRVAVTLSEPYGPFLLMLSYFNSSAILPAHIYKGTNIAANPASRAPIGTGPFKFVEWKPGDSVRFAKNENYWRKGLPHLDGIVIRHIPNAGSRFQALKAGEGDYIYRYYMPSNAISLVKEDPNLRLERSGAPPVLYWAAFNTTRKPFDQKPVRQALFSVIDRKYIQTVVYSANGEAATTPFGGKLIPWVAAPEVNFDKLYPNNVAAANKVLDEAGLKPDSNGIRFTTTITYDSAVAEWLGVATAIQTAWKPLGIKVEFRPVERTVLVAQVYQEANFDITLSTASTYGDPAIGLSRLWLSSFIGRDLGNPSRYSSPEADALFGKAATLVTLDERAAVYRQLEKVLAEDMPIMALYETSSFDAASKKLHDAWGYAMSGHWSTAWLEK